MSTSEHGPSRTIGRRRSGISLEAADLVTAEKLTADTPLPLVFRPNLAGVDLLGWVRDNVDLIRDRLLAHGAVLFRGFTLEELGHFETIVRAIGTETLEYTYASTPRSQVSGRIYTSTEYPATQTIPMHNEMSYTTSWPMKVAFYSIRSAPHGGETPLADSRRVTARIPAGIRERFAAKSVMYVRNYGDGLDLSWPEVFQTDDRGQVERFCRETGIDYEWVGANGLRTRQVCQAFATHPATGDTVWFNQAHLFHVSSLAPEMRDALLGSVGEENLPRNTYYGDGTPIPDADLDAVRAAYEAESLAFRWQDGDITVVENMLVAHGRRPFSGPRRLVVAMAESYDGGRS